MNEKKEKRSAMRSSWKWWEMLEEQSLDMSSLDSWDVRAVKRRD